MSNDCFAGLPPIPGLLVKNHRMQTVCVFWFDGSNLESTC